MPRWMCGLLAGMLLTSGPTTLLAQQSGPKVGVFDPETVWKLTEVGKKYNQDLNDARDRLQGEIDKKQAEIDAVKDRLRQQQQTLSEDKSAQMQKDIQNKMIELNRLNDDATREMKSQLNDVQNRFQQMLVETLEVYGKEKNFTLVLDKSVIAYSSPQIDVTQDLIQKFNDMHKAASAPAAGKTPTTQPKKTPEKTKETPKETPKPPGGR